MKFLPLFALAALIFTGAGCEATIQRWTSDTPIAVSPYQKPTSASSTAQVLPVIDWHQPYLLQLASEDQRLKTQLTVAGDRVVGRYQLDKTEGEVYGSASTSTGMLAFALYQPMSGDPVARATSTWTNAGMLQGEVTLASSTTQALHQLPAQTTEVKVSLLRFQQEWHPDARSGCVFSVLLPSVDVGKDVSAAAAQKMNAEIKKTVLYRKLATPSAAAEAYLRDCKATVISLKKTFNSADDPGSALQGSQETSVVITHNQDQRLSLLVDQYEYAGGAHGNTVRTALVFDTKTGERLSLQDFVKEDQLKPFMQRQAQELLRLYKDLLFEDAASSSQEFVADKTVSSSQTQVKQFGGINNFFLTPLSLTMFYQPYEIAPYAVGMAEVAMPYDSWKDLKKTAK